MISIFISKCLMIDLFCIRFSLWELYFNFHRNWMYLVVIAVINLLWRLVRCLIVENNLLDLHQLRLLSQFRFYLIGNSLLKMTFFEGFSGALLITIVHDHRCLDMIFCFFISLWRQIISLKRCGLVLRHCILMQIDLLLTVLEQFVSKRREQPK